MEIIDSKKAYKAPRANAIEVNVQGVLCGSENGNTEKFVMSSRSYRDDDFE